MNSRLLIFLCSIMTCISCNSVSGPEMVSAVGIIEFYSDPPRIQVPPSAAVGEDISVVIDTYGGGDCIIAGGTIVEQLDDFAVEITPMDDFPQPGADIACSLRPQALRHEATLSFDRAGDVTLTIRGRRYSGDGSYAKGGEVIRVERSISITSE